MNGREEDIRWEKKLGIETGTARHEKDDSNHSRYEPTPYAVLMRLAQSGLIGRENMLVDYGCGKGRVSFFMSHATGCKSIGVEYDAHLYAAAMENLLRFAGRRELIDMAHENAETFDASGADCFYFFNPFSVRILSSVLGRIYESYYAQQRPVKLFFYYALDEYLSLLMTEPLLRFEGEIDCRDLFHNDDAREKILIFSIE